jgi:hypothetical protein
MYSDVHAVRDDSITFCGVDPVHRRADIKVFVLARSVWIDHHSSLAVCNLTHWLLWGRVLLTGREAPEEITMDTELCVSSATTSQINSWLRKMNRVPSIRGHAYSREGDAAWCSCGHYLGGLERHQPHYTQETEPIETYLVTRHQLHLMQIHNR